MTYTTYYSNSIVNNLLNKTVVHVKFYHVKTFFDVYKVKLNNKHKTQRIFSFKFDFAIWYMFTILISRLFI